MSARAGNSIRSSRSPALSATRRDNGSMGGAWPPNQSVQPNSSLNATTNPISTISRSNQRSRALPREMPASSSPASQPHPAVLPRPATHSRNIPFHSRSARTVLPPAVLPRPQRGSSQPHATPSPVLESGQRPRANSYNTTPQQLQQQPQPQQHKQRPSPPQASAQTTLDLSYQPSLIGGPVPSSAPVSYPLPRERGVYPAPHSAARPSPVPQRVSQDERWESPRRNSPQRPSPPRRAEGSVSDPNHFGGGIGGAPAPYPVQQQQHGQPSPPRAQPRGGGVYFESMDLIPAARTSPSAVPPPPQQQQQQQQRHAQQQYSQKLNGYPPHASPTQQPGTANALVLRPSPPSPGVHRRRAHEDSRDRGTRTDDIEAYAHAASVRRPQQHRQQTQRQQPSQPHSRPVYYEEDVPVDQYAVALYRPPPPPPPPQQQQQSSSRPVDYYSLAPSLHLAQHRHVRHIVAGEVKRERPAPYHYHNQQQPQEQPYSGYQVAYPQGHDEEDEWMEEGRRHAPSQQQQRQQQLRQQQLLLLTRAPAPAMQHGNLESSTSLMSETSSTRSSRTRQVFRRQPFLTGALPAGSPYGARPTYAVAVPRTDRAPTGLYAPPQDAHQHDEQQQQQRYSYEDGNSSSSNRLLQQHRPPQPPRPPPPRQQQWGAVEVIEPTVEELYLGQDEEGGRVVEYEPEPRRQDMVDRQQRQQQQPYAERPAPRRAAPRQSTAPYSSSGVPMRQVIHYHPSPQPQRETYDNAIDDATALEGTYDDNSYSYKDADEEALSLLPPAPQPKTKRRAHQRAPPPMWQPRQQQQQQQQPSSVSQARPRLPAQPQDLRIARTPSGGSQQAPPPTLPPPRTLHSQSEFHPARLPYENDDSLSEQDGYGHIYPAQYDVLGAAGRRSSAQDHSEQPSSATLAAPLKSGYRLEEDALVLDSDANRARRRKSDEVARDEEEEPQRPAHPRRQRHRGSPPAGRRPRKQQPLPEHVAPAQPQLQPQLQQQQQQRQPRFKNDLSVTAAGRPEDVSAQSQSTRTEVASVAPKRAPPLPPPQLQETFEAEEEVAEEPQPSEASPRHSIVKDPNGSQSFDLDSTIDSEDVLAQQEAKKLAAELVRRSLLPPTPYVAAQPMDGPAPYSDESEEESEGPTFKTVQVDKEHVTITEKDDAAEDGKVTTSVDVTVVTAVVVAQPDEPAAAHPVHTQDTAEEARRDGDDGDAVLSKNDEDIDDADVAAHASPMSAYSEVPHSVHVAQGSEVISTAALRGNRSVEGLNLWAPEKRMMRPAAAGATRNSMQVPLPVPPEELEAMSATDNDEGDDDVKVTPQTPEYPRTDHEVAPNTGDDELGNNSCSNNNNHNNSLVYARETSHEDATPEDIDVCPPSDEEQQQEQRQEQQHEPHLHEDELDLQVAEDTLKATGESAVEEETRKMAAAQPLLVTSMPQPVAQPEEEQQQQKQLPTAEALPAQMMREDGAIGEDDLGESPLDIGERYGYVDPLEEATMDAAYMLDTLEDQYVRVNEETGEEMEDLVHIVELNRYDRATEPRYFLPKGQYSDVLPLLRYPATAVPASAEEAKDGARTSAPDVLTYVPLSEAGYVNLCAVIWLTRFNSEDTARLLAATQGLPPPPTKKKHQQGNQEEDAAQMCYFDHPSCDVVEVLDRVTAQRVQSVIDELCAMSGESFATACVRLADRNNLSYLPPAVWQQSTTNSTLGVTSIADHVTEVLLTATVPQEAARRQAARRAMVHEVERRAQKTWPLFLGALPWDYEEVVEAETFASMPTAAARLAYAFMYKARMRNLEGGLGALTFSALSAQIPDAAVMDSLLMQEKLRLALLYSYKNVAACCALRQRAVKARCVSSSLGNSQVAEREDSSSREETATHHHSANTTTVHNGWNSPVFSAYLQLWEGSRMVNTTPADSLPHERASKDDADHLPGGEEDVVDLYSIAAQLNCFFPTKTERGMHQLCAALIEDLIAMEALMVPEEVRTPEGAVLTEHTAIVDALVVEGAQAMRHVIMTLSEVGYTNSVSTDDYVDASGRVDASGLRAAMESYLVLFDPAVMYFLSSPVPVDALFRYVRSDGPPSMQPHTLGHKSTFLEVLRLQHIAETIQYAMEMQDAILVASQYNHLVAVHRKRMKQQQQQQQQPSRSRATPRSLAEELQMDAVVVGQSMDLILNAPPLLSRAQGSDASLLAELANGDGAHLGAEEVALSQEEEDEHNATGEEVLVRAVLVALCCTDPSKPVGEVQEYLRHLLTLYAEFRDEHNNPVEASDPLQVAHARAVAAEMAMVDWFGQTAADGTLQPGAAPAPCDERRVNAEELAALCPRVLSRRVGLASTAVADAAAVISASAQALMKEGGVADGASEDSVLFADTSSRPPRAR